MHELDESLPTGIDASLIRIALAISRYHRPITGALRDGAVDAFLAAGGQQQNLAEFWCPGSFELITTCRALADQRYDAVVALGCVISGETAHDQFINTAVSHGLANIIIETGVSISFGLLTCQSIEHARARAGGEKGNKGAEAMRAAIESVALIERIRTE